MINSPISSPYLTSLPLKRDWLIIKCSSENIIISASFMILEESLTKSSIMNQ